MIHYIRAVSRLYHDLEVKLRWMKREVGRARYIQTRHRREDKIEEVRAKMRKIEETYPWMP